MTGDNCFIHTYTGQAIDLRGPEQDQIRLSDIAHGLARCNRWCGQTQNAYSVAQHSVYVAQLLEFEGHTVLTQFQGLMHDASEAYLGDMSRPLKDLCPGYREIEALWEGAIEMRFGIEGPLHPSVKAMDIQAYRVEARDLYDHPMTIDPPARNYPKIRYCWNPSSAEVAFRTRFFQLWEAIQS